MNNVNDGGPAFPVPTKGEPGDMVLQGHLGMSLRDWLAGQALAAMDPTNCAIGSIPKLANALGTDAEWRNSLINAVAESSFAIADAMLKAREKKPCR